MKCFTNNYAEHIDNLDLAQKLATHLSKENPRVHARRLVSCAPRSRCLQKNHIASTEIGERVMLRNHCLSSWQTTGTSGIAPEKRFDYAVSRMIATSVVIFAVSDSGSTDGAGSLHVK